MSASDLDEACQLLYSGPRATFLERRKELAAAARAAGDRELAALIAALRKPSAAAHLVNLLAQAHDDALTELIELGASIRAAFEQGDDVEMRELLQRRAGAIADTVAHARAMARSAGDAMSPAVAEQVTQTLRAAMASAAAAEDVRRGTLTDSLDDPGFTALGVAPPPRQRTPKPAAAARKAGRRGRSPGDVPDDVTGTRAGTGAETEAAEREAQAEAARAAELLEVETAAAAGLEAAERELASAANRRAEIERRRDELVAQLAEADDELTAARDTETSAERARAEATAALEEAREARAG